MDWNACMHAIVFSLVFYLNTVEPHRTPSGPAILIVLCKEAVLFSEVIFSKYFRLVFCWEVVLFWSVLYRRVYISVKWLCMRSGGT